MLSEALNYIRDNFQAVELASLVVGATLASTWAYSRFKKRPLTQRGGWNQRRKAMGEAENNPDLRKALGQMLRYQTARDSLERRSLRRSFETRQSAAERVQGAIGRYNIAVATADAELENILLSLRDLKMRPVAITNLSLIVSLNIGLFIGDTLIVSTALQTVEGSLDSNQSRISALALATSIWLGGKTIGDGLTFGFESKERRDMWFGGSKAVFGLGLLGVGGWGLALLRVDDFATWLLLSIAPGLGSAALSLLSSNESHKTLRGAEGRWRISRRLADRRIIRLSWAAKRLSRLDARFSVRIAQTQLDEVAIAAQYGFVEPEPVLANTLLNSHELETAYFALERSAERVQGIVADLEAVRSAASERHQQMQLRIEEVKQQLRRAG